MKTKLWWLAQTPGWGAVKLRQISSAWGTAEQILQQISENTDPAIAYGQLELSWSKTENYQLEEVLRITPRDLAVLWEHYRHFRVCEDDCWRWMEKGVGFVTIWDEEYPARLRTIYDYPFALYFRGGLPQEDRRTAAIIGARACSGYGAGHGRKIARELADHGVQIISGLAYGVDSEGHWGALESGVTGATYAILGCGVDRCYPREHEKLADQILANGGGLISEFPPGTEPTAQHFPMRNRIISGLSDCILVMEARRRSGSLITVDQALEQGREVFALPGRVGDSLSEGCHQLIRHGANLLTDSADVLEYLFSGFQREETLMETAKQKKRTKKTNELKMTEKENGREKTQQSAVPPKKNLVYSCLDPVGKTIEEIMELTGLSLVQVRTELLELLMEDQIRESAKGYYSIVL